ncbi:FR47-like protein [bacterium A37T11]|nr:FR47-like protein [bacterium A37T11]
MNHVLDNPIYNALSTGNKSFSNDSRGILIFPPDVAPFVGLKNNSTDELAQLYNMAPDGSNFVLFSVSEVSVPKPWEVIGQMEIWQMVYNNVTIPANFYAESHSLTENDVPAMLELTELTKPGPFLKNTFRFGNYLGFKCKGALVAMAGQRLQPLPYVEISAVCTHPEHTGKGYASSLITEQVKLITTQGNIPFLHVRTDNLSAIRVYEKLGFSIRRMIYVSSFKKLLV